MTRIRGHIASSSSPSPLRFMPCIFIARRLQPLLPPSTRVELRLPTLGALSSCFFFLFENIFKISPRWDSSSRANIINNSIRRLPLGHRVDRLYALYISFKLKSASTTMMGGSYSWAWHASLPIRIRGGVCILAMTEPPFPRVTMLMHLSLTRAVSVSPPFRLMHIHE